MDAISQFIQCAEGVIFVFDQMNGLAGPENKDEKDRLYGYLHRFMTEHKSILSTSVNHNAFLQQMEEQTPYDKMYVYGGFTAASL